MHATDIVGWVVDGAAYCVAHRPEGDEVRPVFASDEGWAHMTCDHPHNAPGEPLRFETLGDAGRKTTRRMVMTIDDDIITIDRAACTVTIHTDEIPGYSTDEVDESLWDEIYPRAVKAAGELAGELGRPAQIYDDEGNILAQIDEPMPIDDYADDEDE